MSASAAATSTAIASFRDKLRAELATLTDRTAPPSGNRIGLKGKIFSLPDGTTSPGPLACVILDWRIDHEYYDKPYNSQNPVPPVCWALSPQNAGLTPSERAPKPQAETCAGCEKNKFGSAATGKGKACKNMRRIAVVPADATAETEPMLLFASPTATGIFDSYVTGLAAGDEGQSSLEVITHVAFKADTDYPTLVFGKPVPLSDEKLGIMMTLRAKAQAMLDAEPKSD